MLELEILTYLGALAGTQGVNAFAGKMLDTPDVCTVVNRYGGAPPEGQFGAPGFAVEFPGVQILCRGVANDYSGPEARIKAMWKKMGEIQAMTLSGVLYRFVSAGGSPFPFPANYDAAKGRRVWTCSFICEKEPGA